MRLPGWPKPGSNGQPSTSNGVRTRRHTLGARPLRAFSYPQFRLLWAASLISFISFFMILIARGWLILQLTDSPFQVTAVNAISMLPMMLFSGWGGVIADRFNRRTVLVAGETFNFLVIGVHTVLLFADVIEVWQVYALALANGAVFAFYHPARNAMVPNVVRPRDIASAVSLFTTIFSGSQLIGPALAGYVIEWWGMSMTFLIATLFVVPAGIMALWLPGSDSNQRQVRQSTWKSIMEGMDYIRVRPLLMGLTLLGLVGTVFALPYNSILPVFADDVLHAGADGLGLLGAGAGVGGLLGAFTVAFFSGYRQLKFLLIGGGVTLGLMILLFSLSEMFLLSLGLVTIVGFAMTLFLTSNMAMLQLASPDYIRGRVIGIRLIIMGMGPIGMLLLGAGAELVAPSYSLALFGALTMALILLVVAGIPALRQAENFVHQDAPQTHQTAPVEAVEGDGG